MKKSLWIEVLGENPPLSCPDSLASCQDFVLKHGFSSIYLQVYRAGEAWGRSGVFPSAPFERNSLNHSADPVHELIDWASSHKIEVHLWCNIFQVGSGGIAAAHFRDLFGLEVFLEDASGNTPPFEESISGLTIDAPGFWLDPACTELISYYTRGFCELLEQYPKASGLHLDYFRYPYYLPIRPSSAVRSGSDFGYGKESIQRFISECGVSDPFKSFEGKKVPKDYDTALLWDEWRRGQLDFYLSSFRSVLAPDQKLSVATVAWPERAYMSAYQNWQKWLREDLVDAVLPMIYTADHEMFLNLCLQARAFEGKTSKIIPGIGAYLFTKESSFQKQVSLVGECEGVNEYCLFSYRNIKDRSWNF